ncbi:MAG: hypothetical protein R3B74_06225 [Nitrospirales bacterium]|nr:hypothetical protein [Nitrospirales bacterium]
MTHLRRAFGFALLLSVLHVLHVAAEERGFIQKTIEDFAQSRIEFPRARSNVPFTPLAILGAGYYDNAKVHGDGRGMSLKYDVTTVYQGAGIPFLLGERDVLIVGEYLNRSEFNVRKSSINSFHVTSVGLPVGWLRQVNPDWQAAAFFMPLANFSSLDNGELSWQYMGGAFGRYVQNERLWWAFGFFADIAPDGNLYLPYLGVSWSLNEHWTFSFIMPWPGIYYAPTPEWLLRLGASPSGSSWSVNNGNGNVALNLDAWDFSLGIERRVISNFWASLDAGVGGMRGLRLSGSKIENVDFDVDSSLYVGLALKFRPSLD